MNQNNIFILYADCVITQGSQQSTIVDLGRNRLDYIPNDMALILRECSGKINTTFLQKYTVDNQETILGYIKFLIGKQYGSIMPSALADNFPDISFLYKSPYILEACLYDFSEDEELNGLIIDEVHKLGVHSLVVNFSSCKNKNSVLDFLNQLRTSRPTEFIIVLSSMLNYSKNDLIQIIEEYPRINKIFVWGKNTDEYHLGDRVVFTTKKMNEILLFQPSFYTFEISVPFFSQATSFNTGFYKKIYINSVGDIYNIYGADHAFGNLKESNLSHVINSTDFQKKWNVNKDIIEVCKDCEFRRICNDTCDIIYDEDKWIRRDKCGYNPYTGEWSEWSTNPLKQKAIEHYGMQDLVAEKA